MDTSGDSVPNERDLFPSLDQRFARRVQDDLDKRFQKEASKISWEDWQRLKPVLSSYAEEVEYMRGFLNKGQARKLRYVSKRSEMLLKAIGDVEGAGMVKVLEYDLQVVGLDLAKFRVVLEKWQEELNVGKKLSPEWDNIADQSLYEDFSSWWQSATGTRPKIKESREKHPYPTPFMYVANEVFNLPGLTRHIGASSTSLKNLRSANNKRREKFRKLAQALKRHQKTP